MERRNTRRDPSGRPPTPGWPRSTTSPAPASPRQPRPRWPATRGRRTRCSGTGSGAGARSAASPIRSTPARRRWPPTWPSGPRPASSRPCRPRRRRIAAAARSAGRADPTKTPLVADTLRGIARQHAAVPEAAPRQAAALDYAPALDLMRAAGRPHQVNRLQVLAATSSRIIGGRAADDSVPSRSRLQRSDLRDDLREVARQPVDVVRVVVDKAHRPRRVRVADGDIVHPNASDRFDGNRAEPHQNTAARL